MTVTGGPPWSERSAAKRGRPRSTALTMLGAARGGCSSSRNGSDVLKAVDRAPHRPALEDRDDVGGRQGRHALAGPGAGRAEMRDENDVVELGEARRHGGLVLVDVEAGAKARVRAAVSDEGGLVDERAATGVDEHGPLLHGRQLEGADEVLRLGGERRMDADHVAGGQQLGQGRGTAAGHRPLAVRDEEGGVVGEVGSQALHWRARRSRRDPSCGPRPSCARRRRRCARRRRCRACRGREGCRAASWAASRGRRRHASCGRPP